MFDTNNVAGGSQAMNEGLGINKLSPISSNSNQSSLTSSNYEKYLQLATEKNPCMILELELDGKVRYGSPQWNTIIGVVDDNGSSATYIADLVLGSDQDKAVFQKATDMLLMNDDTSYTITFNVRAAADEGGSESCDNDSTITTLEARGILIRDSHTQLPSHTMWIVKPRTNDWLDFYANEDAQDDMVIQLSDNCDDIVIQLPEEFSKTLGFGAKIFIQYLKRIRLEMIMDEFNLPLPKMELCRVCENFVPVWWLETHSQSCVCEHRTESLIQLLHDNLLEQLAILTNFNKDSEYKGTQLQVRSSNFLNQVLDSLRELCHAAISINPSEMVPDLYQSISTFPQDNNNNNALLDQFPVQKDSVSLNSYFQFSPRTNHNIQNVTSWQSRFFLNDDQDPGLALLIHDTLDLARKKVDAVLRLDNAMTYSLKIKNEVNNYVVQLIREQIEINKHAALAHSINMRPSSAFHSPLPQDPEAENLIYSSSTPLQVQHNQCMPLDSSSKPHLEPIPFPSTSSEGASSVNDIRHPSPLPRSCNNIVMKLPTPQRKINSNELFSDAYLNADIIPNSTVEPTISIDIDDNTNSRSSSIEQYGTDNATVSRITNSERPSSSSSRLGVRSRSITPRQKMEYSHVNSDEHAANEMFPRDKDSLQPETSTDTTITSSTQTNTTGFKNNSNNSTNSVLPKLMTSISLTPRRGSPLFGNLTSHSMQQTNSFKLIQDKSPISSPFTFSKDFLTPEQHPSSLARTDSVNNAMLNSPNLPLSPLLLATNQTIKSPTPSIRDYDILKPISKGAYGSVYLARKKLTGDYFAIKVLRKSDMIAKNQVTNVKSERAIMMVQSDKPYVARLFASFQNKDNLFLVMEYLPGGDLATLIKMMGYLPDQWAKQYLTEIVVGVDDMHQNGIIHHDLKPENLLIDNAGHVKLTDFGLSRAGLIRRHKFIPHKSSLSISSTLPIDNPVNNNFTMNANNSNHSQVSTPDSFSSDHKTYNKSKKSSLGQQYDHSEHSSNSNSHSMTPTPSSSTVIYPSYYRGKDKSHGSSNIDLPASLRRSESQLSFSLLDISRSSTPPLANPQSLNTNNVIRRKSLTENKSFSNDLSSLDVITTTNTNASSNNNASVSPAPSDLALFYPDDSKQNKKFFGTPDYLAPETIEGKGEDNKQCDWWSVGCIFFELLLGYPPFHAETPDAVFKKILSGVIQWPEFKNEEEEREFLTPEAKDLIEKLLVVDPSKRLGVSGIQEIKDQPYFRNVDWDHVYDEEASFVPTIDNPEDTDYFDLRGAELQDFGDDIESDNANILFGKNGNSTDVSDLSAANLSPPPNHRNVLSRRLSMSNTNNRGSSNSSSCVHDFGAHTPVNKLSIASVLESVPQEIGYITPGGTGTTTASAKNSPNLKNLSLAIPPHMRDRRSSKLNDSQTEFGSFNFRNLSALDKANKDAINRLKSEHFSEQPGVHRRTSSASLIGSSSDGYVSTSGSNASNTTSSGKLKIHKPTISGSPSTFSTFPKTFLKSDSFSTRSYSPERSISIDSSTLSRKGSLIGDSQQTTTNSSDSPTMTKFKSPLSPANTNTASSYFSRQRVLSKSFSQRTNSSDLSADESDRLQAISRVNSLRNRRRSGRKSSSTSEIGYHMDALVCEPIPIHRYRVAKDLENLGCTVVSVGAGDELVSRATSGVSFDLIMTALKLPKLGAIDIVQLLRQTNGANSTTPIVAITNYFQEAITSKVFDDVLEKPVNLDELKKLVAKYALKKSQEDEEHTILSDSDETH
ncbi:hypothetical protein SKDZ_06G0320 [Saccharomyces kudriavzevii ZP591]|nr:hypothetical protein SKDZ_06G0320 [Saccharomyces kudriavzevii ZP591]